MLFEADYAKNYASILYQCLVRTVSRGNLLEIWGRSRDSDGFESESQWYTRILKSENAHDVDLGRFVETFTQFRAARSLSVNGHAQSSLFLR